MKKNCTTYCVVSARAADWAGQPLCAHKERLILPRQCMCIGLLALCLQDRNYLLHKCIKCHNPKLLKKMCTFLY